MAHRVFRLSIAPERAPEVRRVVDFDGAATLHDVHDIIQRTLGLDDDHLYAFYLSGRYFDRGTEHGILDDSKHDPTRSRLFRLGLRVGQTFGYLFDFGDELRHTITVVSITETDAELTEPVLVESVGGAPRQYGGAHSEGRDDDDARDGDDDGEPYEMPERVTKIVPLAEAVLSLSERLDALYQEEDAKHEEEGESDAPRDPPDAIVSLLREMSKAALELAATLEHDGEALHDLDEWSAERELLPRLVELPLGLLGVGELESALAVARAYTFVAPESYNGDVGIILAESGKRDEAIRQVEANQKEYPQSFITALKAGAAYEALGDSAAAEASYRNALRFSEDDDDRTEALSQLADFLDDAGRSDEADALFPSTALSNSSLVNEALAAVGRNDPCPCGSGKKYKRCHGA